MQLHQPANGDAAPPHDTITTPLCAQVPQTKEDIIGGPGKTTMAKRDREKARQLKQREKEEQRAQRKANKRDRRPTQDGEDPDLAGLSWGPQPPLY